MESRSDYLFGAVSSIQNLTFNSQVIYFSAMKLLMIFRCNPIASLFSLSTRSDADLDQGRRPCTGALRSLLSFIILDEIIIRTRAQTHPPGNTSIILFGCPLDVSRVYAASSSGCIRHSTENVASAISRGVAAAFFTFLLPESERSLIR